jgi:hypothetical protein
LRVWARLTPSRTSHDPPTQPQEAKACAQASEAKEIPLYGGMVLDGKRVFINKLDGTLAALKECE